jgi:transcriptional antiterminator Rof (Rho-off)
MSQNLHPAHNPDELEVAAGTQHDQLEGWVPQLASDAEVRDAFEKAFDYRGDVTLTLKSGEKVEGYIFDRRTGKTAAESVVRLIPAGRHERRAIPYSEIAALAFTGRDTAAGKSYEAWVKKYWEKRQAGEKNIGIEPEKLD